MSWNKFSRISLLSLVVGLCLIAFSPVAPAHGVSAVSKQLASDSLEQASVLYSLEGFTQDTVTIGRKAYKTINFEGCSYIDMEKAGQPRLPKVTESFIIPDTAKMEASVISSDYYEITGIEIAPSKGTITRAVDPASVPYTFGGEYQQDAFYPGSLIHLREPFIMRDVRGVVLETMPFQYNPVQKVLRVYTNIEVKLEQVGEDTVNIIDRATYGYHPSSSFEGMYARQFANYEVAKISNNSLSRTEPPSEDGTMLVICHGPYMTAMGPFVDWKNSIGIDTALVDVATIGNNSTAIGNYIDNAYNNGNLSFVLLVGDHNHVKSNSHSYTVSDPDYSTITPDWYPEILIGRFSADSVADVETQVARTIAYEQAGHDVAMGGWNASALGVASSQGPGHYGEYDDEHVDLMLDELAAVGFTTFTRSYDNNGGSTNRISTAVNNGVRTIQYTGHGWTGGWGNGGGFDNNNVNALTNVGELPFVVSVACNVGEFDSGTCFCEAWMRATHNGQPTGAIAHYGSTVSQSWDPPMYGQGNHGHSGKYAAIERFCLEMNWSIGAQWFGGSCIMMDIVGTAGRDEFRAWTCFGDPSLRTYGAAGPQTLTADRWNILLNSPVQVNFDIMPGSEHAGRPYFLLSGMTGTSPGTTLPGGEVLPINFDVWTYFVLSYMNSLSIFTGFTGTLDAAGEATAMFDTTGYTPIDPRLLGETMQFSAAIKDPGNGFVAVTNAKTLTFSN